jgi:hypothetical protein
VSLCELSGPIVPALMNRRSHTILESRAVEELSHESGWDSDPDSGTLINSNDLARSRKSNVKSSKNLEHL